MRAILFLLFTLQLAAGLYANDTLTRAQVYNFNVGDTFDYKGEGQGCNPMSSSTAEYYRYIIKDIYYSGNGDTLFVVRLRQHPTPATNDTLVIDSLGRYEILTHYNLYSTNYVVDSNPRIIVDSSCVPAIINSETASTMGNWFTYTYSAGLGVVAFDNTTSDGSCNFTGTLRMVYYSKGNVKCGKPYYELNGSTIVHFTPIPEECAVWSSQVRYIKEQIATGGQIAYHGHTFVEMIYRAIDTLHNIYTPDSLIGYFRNDTVNEKTLFYKTIDGLPFFEYDYKLVEQGDYCRGVDQILIGGQLKTRWEYDKYNSRRAYSDPRLYYVEGIGGLNGLIPVMNFFVAASHALVDFAELTSFCVCGQAIYPNSSASCALLSGVNEVARQYPIFALSPNPAGSSVVITLGENTAAQSLSITDITGRTLVSLQLPSSTSTLSTETLPEGIYFVTISNGMQSAAKKLVIAK